MIKKPIISPRLGILFGILAVSTASIFIKFVQQEKVASLVIAAYRLGIATIVLSPIALYNYRNEIKKLSAKDLRFSLLSGFFLAIHFATWIQSLEYTSVASSVVLVTTTPLWVALFSPFTLNEKITKMISIGLVFSLLGTIVVGLSDICDFQNQLVCPPFNQFFQGQALWGDFLALVGAWTAAGYVMIGRRIRPRLSLVPYVFLVYGMAAVLLVLFMLGSGVQYSGFSGQTYIWLVLLALIPQLMGHSTFNWALGYLPAALVSVSLLGEPIGSTILAYIFLAEAPGIIKVFGAILIFAGIVIASRKEKPVAP
ncbi:MAG: DMT family transporter [Anaerolineales bacterium]|jgi:drug/metabolite transporter (DMT)-like permease